MESKFVNIEIEREYVYFKRRMDKLAQVLFTKDGQPVDDLNALPVKIAGASDTASGAVGVNIKGSETIQPVDIQKRYAETIQTHNAVSVGLSGTSASSWIDCDGFTEIAFSLLNDAIIGSYGDVQWSTDGVSIQGLDYVVIPSNTNRIKSGSTQVKLRYARLNLVNGDSALAHTMSAWAYLKA